MSFAALVGGVALAGSAHGAEITRADVLHEKGRYTVEFDVRIKANTDAVRRLMTDYGQLTKLSDTVIESQVLRRWENGKQRVKLVMEGCVLFFCKTVHKVEDVETLASGDIVTTAIPEQSDFDEAIERWQITADAQHTRVRYSSQMTPSFFIPPLIGPPIMKSKLRKELEGIVERLEQLAGTP